MNKAPDLRRKISDSQKQRLITFAKDNPCFNRSEIARHYGLSRERVRQILSKSKINTRTQHITLPKTRYCQCGNIITTKSVRYCDECRNVPLVCSQCGTLFSRHITYIKRVYTNPKYKGKFVFCSQRCEGKHLCSLNKGKSYKLGKICPSKYDNISNILKESIESGETPTSMSKRLAIPSGTIYYLIKRFHIQYDTKKYRKPRQQVTRQLGIPIAHIKVKWLHRLGFTEAYIQSYIPCSKSTIHRALRGKYSGTPIEPKQNQEGKNDK